MGTGQLDRPVTITLIEDLDVVVEGVRAWVAADRDARASIIAVGNSIETALSDPGRTADVVVLDLGLDEREISKRWIERVAKLSDNGLRVVVYSIHVGPLLVNEALRAGACAFLDKGTERDQFVDTVVAVALDQPVVTPSTAGGLLNSVRLSKREREALQYRFQGMKLTSIAARLTKENGEHISVPTVKDYLNRARAKFAAAGRPCRSNYALLACCIDLGLITPDEIEDY